jgi:hypothetical protein
MLLKNSVYFLSILLVKTILLASILHSTEGFSFNKSKLEKSYKLNNENIIFIEQYERGNRIWEKNTKTNTFKNISHVWNFIALAERCETLKEENIYFAHNLEYWLGGGNNIDNPQIRIFRLFDNSPWRDSDLGIVPNMKWARKFCIFYKEE